MIAAEMVMTPLQLNITVILLFYLNCALRCQQQQYVQLEELKISAFDPIMISQNGLIQRYRISSFDLSFVPLLYTEPTSATTATPLDAFELIFRVNYSVTLADSLEDTEGIIDEVNTLNHLTRIIQATLPNNTNIRVTIFNASLAHDNNASFTRMIKHMLILIVIYRYDHACDTCRLVCYQSMSIEPVVYGGIPWKSTVIVDLSSPTNFFEIVKSTTFSTDSLFPQNSNSHTLSTGITPSTSYQQHNTNDQSMESSSTIKQHMSGTITAVDHSATGYSHSNSAHTTGHSTTY